VLKIVPKIQDYRVIIHADVSSSLSKKELENKLVISLFDIETGEKISDGGGRQLEVMDYDLTEASPI
jgi:predicted site-specific integrase-resolvase